jgi:phosphatidylglycerol---prolipoprotein diacylglyceryl transferase
MYRYVYLFNMQMEAWLIFTIIGYVATLAGMLLTRPVSLTLNRPGISICALTYLITGIIGSLVLSIAIHPEKMQGLSTEYILRGAGSAFFGEPIFGFTFLWILCKIKKYSFTDFVDLGLPFLMLSRAFGRIGCLLAGCCYGIAASVPWGFQFLSDGISRHPTQVYAMASAFGIFGASRYVYKNLRNHKAFTAFYVIFFYCFLRFFNEFLRAEGPYIAGQIKLLHPFLFFLTVFSFYKLYSIFRIAPAEDKTIIRSIAGKSLLRMLLWAGFSILTPIGIILISNRIWF